MTFLGVNRSSSDQNLVAAGYVQQVRVLFLMVGHTHVVIDHIFGVVTVGLYKALYPGAIK